MLGFCPLPDAQFVCQDWREYRSLRSVNNEVHTEEHLDSSSEGLLRVSMERQDLYCYGKNIGMPAAASWERLSEQSRSKLLGQLREMIDEMRKMPVANGKISNVDGGSLYDCRLPSLDRFGPFENTQEFHAFLRNSIEKAPPEYPDVDEMISMHRREWGQPVFTHGDLSSLNILVREGDIVGLVDWETAGWYPPYWEYTSACQVNPRNAFWVGYISRFLEPWPEALKMEKTRQRWWGVI